jgi:RHS repeat-associated protein
MKDQVFPVRDGTVQLAGGNLMLQYTDDSVDTLLRVPATISRTFNSATGTWTFNFQTTFSNSIFVDPNGTVYDLFGKAPGPISGSIWTLMDGTHIRTRGGLVYQFDPTDGTLQRIYWLNSPTPYLRFTKSSGVITNIDLCVALNNSCAAKFTIGYANGLVSTVTNNVISATAGTYSWQVTQGVPQLTLAKDAFEYSHSLPGTRFNYTQGQGSCPSGAANCLAVQNSENETVLFGFDSVGRALSCQKVGGTNPAWTFSYATGTTAATDPLGKTTQFDFSDGLHLSKVTLPLGEATSITWSGDRPVTVSLPDGTSASFTWFNDDLRTATPPGRAQITFNYDSQLVNFGNPAVSLPTSVSDSVGTIVTRTPDSYGRVVAETNGLGETTHVTYEPATAGCGGLCWFTLVQSVTDPAGIVRAFTNTFSASGTAHPTVITTGTSNQYQQPFTYTAAGDVTLGPDGSATGSNMPNVYSRTFDRDRLVSAVNVGDYLSGAEDTVGFARRSDGRPIEVSRPVAWYMTQPANSQFLYDSLGQLYEQDERVDGAWGQAIQYGYDDRGAVTSVRRANTMETDIGYDDDGRPIAVVNIYNGVWESLETRTFDHTTGQLLSVTDRTQPNPTKFDYVSSGNGAGRVSQITWPHGERTYFVYDGRARVTDLLLITSDGTASQWIHKVYDLADRLTELDINNSSAYQITYVNGRVDHVTYGNGLVRTPSYDPDTGRVTALTTTLGSTVVETLTDQQSGWSVSGGTPIGQVTQPFTADTFRYDAPAAGTTFGTASTEENVRGGFQLGSPAPAFQGADAMTQQYCGGIDADGVHCALGKPEISYYPASYGYVTDSLHDPCYTVTRGSTTCVIPQPGGLYWEKDTFYHYYRNPEETRLNSVEKEDRVTRPGGTIYSQTFTTLHTYTWDAAGFAATKDGQPITWTATGRLAAIGSNAMTYDAEGGLTSIQFSDGTVWQVRYGGLVMADASGNPLYLDLGFCRVNLTDNTRLYRHPDLRGNVGKSTSNDAGQISSVNSYTPYGIESRQGTDRSDRMIFAQGIVDGSLVFLGPRVFDQDALQFLSPDPAYGLLHQYSYAQGDPIHYWDDGWELRSHRDLGALSYEVLPGLVGGLAVVVLFPEGLPLYAAWLVAPAVGGFVAASVETLYRVAYWEYYGTDIEARASGTIDFWLTAASHAGLSEVERVPVVRPNPHPLQPITDAEMKAIIANANRAMAQLRKELQKELSMTIGLGDPEFSPYGQLPVGPWD